MIHKEKIAKPLLRISMSLVFLYFGFQQVYAPDNWTGFVPDFLAGTIMTSNNWVVLNGVVELSLGIFLLIGLYSKFSSLILSLHLFGIVFSIGLTPLGVRDFGLAFATLVVFLNGADEFCLDWKLKIMNPRKI